MPALGSREMQQPTEVQDDSTNTPRHELRRLVFHLARNVTAASRCCRADPAATADAAELSRATIHLIEAGACDPRVSTIAHLAKALQLTPVELLQPRGNRSHAPALGNA